MEINTDDWTYPLYVLASNLGGKGVPDAEFFCDEGGPGPLFILAGAAQIAAEAANITNTYAHHARKLGHSWAEIGAALGISRQAAHKRFERGLKMHRLAEDIETAHAGSANSP